MRGGIEEEMAALQHEQWRLETLTELEALKTSLGRGGRDIYPYPRSRMYSSLVSFSFHFSLTPT